MTFRKNLEPRRAFWARKIEWPISVSSSWGTELAYSPSTDFENLLWYERRGHQMEICAITNAFKLWAKLLHIDSVAVHRTVPRRAFHIDYNVEDAEELCSTKPAQANMALPKRKSTSQPENWLENCKQFLHHGSN